MTTRKSCLPRPWPFYILLGLTQVALAALIAYGFSMEKEVHTVDLPFLSALRKTTREATATHLWIEDALAGGHDHRHDQTPWEDLDKSVSLLRSLMGFPPPVGQKVETEFYPAVRVQIETLESKLSSWKSLFPDSMDEMAPPWFSVSQHKQFADSHAGFTTTLYEIADLIDLDMEKKQGRFKTSQAFLLGMWLLFGIWIAVGIRRYEREKAESFTNLELRVLERTEQLTAINKRLKGEVTERTLTERSLVKHQQQLRKLSSVLVQTEERERRRIATAIHDGVGQTLAAAKIKLGAVRSSIPPDVWEGQLGEVRGLITMAIEQSRSLTFELSPPVLYEIGLEAALEWMAERFQRKFGLPITIDGDGSDRRLSIPYRVFAFQSVRELCFNAVKHARASRARVSVLEDGKYIRIEVADDGVGFDVKERRKAGGDSGFGLFSMREQLRHYGGSVTLDSRPGSGTRVALRLPMETDSRSQADEDRHDQSAAGGRSSHRP